MLYKTKDTDTFYKVKVTCDWGSYGALYCYIPKIDQIQYVAGTKNHKEAEWEARNNGYRTTLDRLPKNWTVPVEIEELNAAQVATFCPAALQVDYSLHMLEDMQIRNEWKYQKHLNDMKRQKEWQRHQRIEEWWKQMREKNI